MDFEMNLVLLFALALAFLCLVIAYGLFRALSAFRIPAVLCTWRFTVEGSGIRCHRVWPLLCLARASSCMSAALVNITKKKRRKKSSQPARPFLADAPLRPFTARSLPADQIESNEIDFEGVWMHWCHTCCTRESDEHRGNVQWRTKKALPSKKLAAFPPPSAPASIETPENPYP